MKKTMLAIVSFSLGIIFHALNVERKVVDESQEAILDGVLDSGKKNDIIAPEVASKSYGVVLPNVDQSHLAKEEKIFCKLEKQEISTLRNQLYTFTNLDEIDGAENLEETEYIEFVEAVVDSEVESYFESYFERREKSQDYGPYDQVMSSSEYRELYKDLLTKIYSPKELMMQQKYQESKYIQEIIAKQREFQLALTSNERYIKLEQAAFRKKSYENSRN